MDIKTVIISLNVICLTSCFKCPVWKKFGHAPPKLCIQPSDPQDRPPADIERWFTKDIFNDLFPKSNLGWGPTYCRPYNYKAFIIAARYFPRFATEYVKVDPEGGDLKTNYTKDETNKRDLSAFFAHAIQETGENDVHIYDELPIKEEADACFYRGGFFNWFEGGPVSPLVKNKGWDPTDGVYCTFSGRYCDEGTDNKFFYPCANNTEEGGDETWYKGCYFGRGAIQLSYNFNYGLFQRWLTEQNVTHDGEPINILQHPNLVITKTDPPLAIMASLWFYMFPQSPKPAMHDIVIGNWVSADPDYAGGVFGPTSLVINNECNGEDPSYPGGGGENRRIKAFRWFTSYFKVPFCSGDKKTLSCKTFNGGSKNFAFPDGRKVFNSWDADWKTSWDPSQPCSCRMETYQDYVQAFDPNIMPKKYAAENEINKLWCEKLYQEGWRNQGCSKYKPGL